MDEQFREPRNREEAIRVSRERIAELQQRLRALPAGILRHDVSNAVGAAKNALVLFEDAASPSDPLHFYEMACRNVERAEVLLRRDPGDSSPRAPRTSGRNERNDLRRPSEREDHDALGL
jgi:hypothetical protein